LLACCLLVLCFVCLRSECAHGLLIPHSDRSQIDGSATAHTGRSPTQRPMHRHANSDHSPLRFAHGRVTLALSPNGRQLASCSIDGSVRLWDTHTATAIRAAQIGSEWYARENNENEQIMCEHDCGWLFIAFCPSPLSSQVLIFASSV
jgi:WD40 repeat protein